MTILTVESEDDTRNNCRTRSFQRLSIMSLKGDTVMTRPTIQGTGFTLKRTGSSNFWIVGTDISRDDTVKVFVEGELLWTGKIVGNPQHRKARASVSYVGKEKEPGLDDDLAAISVTVTNASNEESEPREDIAVIDGP